MRFMIINVDKAHLTFFRFLTILSLSAILISACGSKNRKNSPADAEMTTQTHSKIVLNQGLERPESIVYDEVNDVFYVSNGRNYGLGDQGFISKISGKGELMNLKWIDSLNRPTGMAIHQGRLYVADVNSLKIIDIANAQVIDHLLEPLPNSGINDVSVSPEGEVFLSASAVHSIFKLDQDQLEVWLTDVDLLKWANGLFATKEKLMVGGQYLTAIDKTSMQITKLQPEPVVEDIDGLWPDGNGGYFISTVGSSSFWQMDAFNKAIQLMTSDSLYFGDLEYVPSKSAVYVPRGNLDSESFCISVIKIE